MDPALCEVAEQIGRLVIESGRLERALLALAFTGALNLGQSPQRLHGLTARPLVIEVRRLADEGAYAAFDEPVLEALAELVTDDADDVLAWRNRYVYASWDLGEDGVYRGITLRDVAGLDADADGGPPVNEYCVESMLYLTFTIAKATDELRRLSQAALLRAASASRLSTGDVIGPRGSSRAIASAITTSSRQTRPPICTPIGRPSDDVVHGRTTAGCRVRLNGKV